MKRSGAGRDADRSDLGGLHAHPQALADAEAQVGPCGGGDAGGHRHTLHERHTHTDEGAIDVNARDDAGQD